MRFRTAHLPSGGPSALTPPTSACGARLESALRSAAWPRLPARSDAPYVPPPPLQLETVALLDRGLQSAAVLALESIEHCKTGLDRLQPVRVGVKELAVAPQL